MTDIDRGQRAADAGFARSGARMIALAERFGLKNGLQRTMSAARAGSAGLSARRVPKELRTSFVSMMSYQGVLAVCRYPTLPGPATVTACQVVVPSAAL